MNEKMLAKFTDICFARLQTIENFIMQIEAGEEYEEDTIVLMRELHTLKGESRIMNLIAMSDVVHVIEDAMLWRNDQEDEAPLAFFNMLYNGLDIINTMCSEGLSDIAEDLIEEAKEYILMVGEWLRAPTEDVPLANTDRKSRTSEFSSLDINAAEIASSEAEEPENNAEQAEEDGNPITQIVTLLKNSQTAPLSEEEMNSLHPLMFNIISFAPDTFRDLAEALHFVLAWLIEQVFMVDDDAFDVLFDGFEFLEALFMEEVSEPEQAVAGFLENLGDWAENNITEPPTMPEPPADIDDSSVGVVQEAAQETKEVPQQSQEIEAPEKVVEQPKPIIKKEIISKPDVEEIPKQEEATESKKPKSPRRRKAKQRAGGEQKKKVEAAFINIEVEQIEALTHISGELHLWQSLIDKVAKDLDRLTGDWLGLVSDEIIQLKRSHNEYAIQNLNKWIKMQALAKEFATHLNQLREGVLLNHVNLEEFQHRIGEIRLQKIGELFQRFPRSIRDLAMEQGKQIQVSLVGNDVAIDKTVIEALFDPMLHLVRNGVDHGIETPEERLANGKPEKATLVLEAVRQGDSVRITISDDGKGINPEHIKATLLRKQLMQEHEIKSLNQQQLINQLFRPGFSTKVEVSHVSGRGVGLDVVKSTVEKLGGSILVESELGKGTNFILTLPISVALSYALIIRIHEGYYAFPIQSVEEILVVQRNDIITVGEGEAVRLEDGSLVSVVGLGSLLDYGEVESSNLEETVILLRTANYRVGIRIDAVVGVRQLVQSNLTPFIRGLRIISGTAMIEGGMIVQFLNVMYLLDLAQEHRKRVNVSKNAKKKSDKVSILIAEDSDLTREMLVSRVNRMGYIVYEAVNGQDGWDQLQYRNVDLVMTDLDMPLMNGFELIRKIRSNRKTQTLPIVVLSTRRTKESKQQAAQAGADAYIVKSAYNEDELLKTFTRLLNAEEE